MRERGYTIVEVSIVLAMVGLAVSLGVPSLQGWKDRMDLRNAAGKLAESLLQARTRSVIERRDYTVSVDYAAETWRASPAFPVAPPPGSVDLYADTSDPDCQPPAGGAVTFRPNATANAAGFKAVYLKSRGTRALTRYRVKVLGATGKISVERLVGGAWVGQY